MSELKPCPFCGGEAELHPSLAGFFVGCFNDGCAVNPSSGEFVADGVWDEEQKEAAIDAWNTRAERTCKAELMPKNRELRMAPWLECSECGAELSAYGTDKYCHGCGAKVVSE